MAPVSVSLAAHTWRTHAEPCVLEARAVPCEPGLLCWFCSVCSSRSCVLLLSVETIIAHSKDVSYPPTLTHLFTCLFQTHCAGVLFPASTQLLHHTHSYTVANIGLLLSPTRKQHPHSRVRTLYSLCGLLFYHSKSQRKSLSLPAQAMRGLVGEFSQ